MSEKIPFSEQLKEIRREIAIRERVYPEWIQRGKIAKSTADFRLAVMKAIAETLAPLAKAEELDV